MISICMLSNKLNLLEVNFYIIIVSRKQLLGTNALAYFEMALMTMKKKNMDDLD
jgi:hypothetical protein